MKLLTITVPCYNSQDYMQKCIESLLVGGDDVEILIVNDGSTDNTKQIAEEYAAKFPNIVKVINKPNGGHGSGVNVGVHSASGLYFKVVDSDDWLEEGAYLELLSKIKEHLEADNLPDMYISNYVYYHSESNYYVMGYSKQVPSGFFDWKDVKNFYFSHVMLMHSFVYSTEKLRENYVDLPENTFYVDNIFAYAPLVHMNKPYYLDIDLYYYFIGREGQSINIDTAISRYKQQVRVMKAMGTAHDYKTLKALPKGLRKYMFHDLHVIAMVTLMFCYGKESRERRAAVKEMWQYIKAYDKCLYRSIRYRGFTLSVVFLPRYLRGKIMKIGYNIIRRHIKLG